MKKSELKEIVRECLVEILTEGTNLESNSRNIKDARKDLKERRQSFDHVRWASSNEDNRKKPDHLENARALTSNPILAEVLADSQKTMEQQMAADRKGPVVGTGDFAQRKAAESDPMSMFEGSSKWASLAFQDK